MDNTDLITFFASSALVAAFLAPVASRLIARATADMGTQVRGSGDDLSRIRKRNR